MNRTCPRTVVAAALACAIVVVADVSLTADDDDLPRYSGWSAPVNLGPVVNAAPSEAAPFISRDGLSLYFQIYTCGPDGYSPCRADGFGAFDLYVSQRDSLDEPWGPPQNLGPSVNTSSNEQTPTLSTDGHRLYFASDRPGTLGLLDLYVARRDRKRDDFGWRDPVNLGSNINTAAGERGPTLFVSETAHPGAGEDETVYLYFSSTRAGGPGLEDIYVSTRREQDGDENFAPAVYVPELCTNYRDIVPAVRKDGLEIFLVSNRPGTIGGSDLFVSTRSSTSEPWGEPVPLGPDVNSPVVAGTTTGLDFRPAISFDGTQLYFHSDRLGGFGEFDLWVTTRTRLRGPFVE